MRRVSSAKGKMRNAVRVGDIAQASQWARVYRLMPVVV